MSMNNMTKKYNTTFDWIVNRLKFKYKENELIIKDIQNFNNEYIHIPKNLNMHKVDELCKKYYPDFNMMKCEGMTMGYTNKERDQIRSMIKDIATSIGE